MEERRSYQRSNFGETKALGKIMNLMIQMSKKIPTQFQKGICWYKGGCVGISSGLGLGGFMYVPSRYQTQDIEKVMKLIRQFPLATVVTVDPESQRPFISHLPLVPRLEEDCLILIGHLARANPHAKLLLKNKVTVIFHGPQGYITPSWYAQDNVPTWNYAVVHIQGSVRMLEETSEILDCVRVLSEEAEKDRAQPWKFWIPDDLVGERLARAIVGFEIRVDSWQAKFKFSQNRNSADYAGVLKGLEEEGTERALELRNWMQKD